MRFELPTPSFAVMSARPQRTDVITAGPQRSEASICCNKKKRTSLLIELRLSYLSFQIYNPKLDMWTQSVKLTSYRIGFCAAVSQNQEELYIGKDHTGNISVRKECIAMFYKHPFRETATSVEAG